MRAAWQLTRGHFRETFADNGRNFRQRPRQARSPARAQLARIRSPPRRRARSKLCRSLRTCDRGPPGAPSGKAWDSGCAHKNARSNHPPRPARIKSDSGAAGALASGYPVVAVPDRVATRSVIRSVRVINHTGNSTAVTLLHCRRQRQLRLPWPPRRETTSPTTRSHCWMLQLPSRRWWLLREEHSVSSS